MKFIKVVLYWMLLLYIQYLEATPPTQENQTTKLTLNLTSSRGSGNYGEDEPLDLESLIQNSDEEQELTLPEEVTNYISKAHPRKKIDKNTLQIIYNLLYPQWGKMNSSWKLECPPTFVKVGHTCLSFACPLETGGWKAARLYCRMIKGGDLAVFSSNADLAAAIQYIKKTDKSRHCSYWIGGSDIDNENNWLWHDGRIMPKGSPPWGQINGRIEPGGGKYENFAILFSKDNYSIHDTSNEEAKNFPVVPLCQVLPSDYIESHGKNYNLLSQVDSKSSFPYKDFIDFLFHETKKNYDYLKLETPINDMDSTSIKDANPYKILETKLTEDWNLNKNLNNDVTISSSIKIKRYGNREMQQNLYEINTPPNYGSKENKGHIYHNNYKPISVEVPNSNKGHSPHINYMSANINNENQPCKNCNTVYSTDNNNGYGNNKEQNAQNPYPINQNYFENYNGPKPNAGQIGHYGNTHSTIYSPPFSEEGYNLKGFNQYIDNKPTYNQPPNSLNGQPNNYNMNYQNVDQQTKYIDNKPTYNQPPSNLNGQPDKFNMNYQNVNQHTNYDENKGNNFNSSSYIQDIINNHEHIDPGSSQINNDNGNLQNFNDLAKRYPKNNDINNHGVPNYSGYENDHNNNNYHQNKGTNFYPTYHSHYITSGNDDNDGKELKYGNNNGNNYKGDNHNNYDHRHSSHYYDSTDDIIDIISGYHDYGSDNGNKHNNSHYGNKKGNYEGNYHYGNKKGNYEENYHYGDLKPVDYNKGSKGKPCNKCKPHYKSQNNYHNPSSSEVIGNIGLYYDYNPSNPQNGNYQHSYYKPTYSGPSSYGKPHIPFKPTYEGHHNNYNGKGQNNDYGKPHIPFKPTYKGQHNNYNGNGQNNNYGHNDAGIIDSINYYHGYNYNAPFIYKHIIPEELESNKGYKFGDNYNGNKDKIENNDNLSKYPDHHFILDSTYNCLDREPGIPYKNIRPHYSYHDDDGHNQLYHQIFHNRYGHPYWGRHSESHVDIFGEIPLCLPYGNGGYKGTRPSKGDQHYYLKGNKGDNYFTMHNGGYKEIYTPISKGDYIYSPKGNNHYSKDRRDFVKGNEHPSRQEDQGSHSSGVHSNKKGDNSINDFYFRHLHHPHYNAHVRKEIFNAMLNPEKGELWPSKIQSSGDHSKTPHQSMYGNGALIKGHYNKNYDSAYPDSFSEFASYKSKPSQANVKFNGNLYKLHNSNMAKIISKFTDFLAYEERKNGLALDMLNQNISVQPNILQKRLTDLTNNDRSQQNVNVTISNSPSSIKILYQKPEISEVVIKDSIIPYNKAYDYESDS